MTLRDEGGELDVGTPYASLYPAVQNFMLAARGLGLGTALTTVHRIYQDEVLALFQIPDPFEIPALVPVGRPSGKFGVAPRKPLEKLTHWNTFGSRRDVAVTVPQWYGLEPRQSLEVAVNADRSGFGEIWIGQMASFDAFALAAAAARETRVACALGRPPGAGGA